MRMRTTRTQRLAVRRRSRGLTLLETLLAMVILGVGVLAFVEAQSSFHRSNAWSSQSATAMLLANEIREYTRNFPRHDPVTGLTLNSGVLTGWGSETGETTLQDLDDLDDLDGKIFGDGGQFPGPINAQGQIVPQIDVRGAVQLDNNNDPVPLIGWRQRVIVEKVDPYNFATPRANSYQQAATASLPFIAVDRFPLRVTVVVEYQGADEANYNEVTRVMWVVPR